MKNWIIQWFIDGFYSLIYENTSKPNSGSAQTNLVYFKPKMTKLWAKNQKNGNFLKNNLKYQNGSKFGKEFIFGILV